MANVIAVEHLRKAYGDTVAVDDVSFHVAQGEIFGILGRNGAGKTTSIECVMGLREPDSGSVDVLGFDPRTHSRELKKRLGVQLQESGLPKRLRVGEAIELFASFFGNSVDVQDLLGKWGLVDRHNAAFADLSGGQKQRLFVALALVNQPEVAFLDELTAGLDPQARRATWELIRAVRDQGTTVVLVTHFMDEAEHLCDRLAIVDQGRVVAMDTPGGLVRQAGVGNGVRFDLPEQADVAWLSGYPGVLDVRRDGTRVTLGLDAPVSGRLFVSMAEHGLDPTDIQTIDGNLEDAFLHFAGAPLRNGEAS